MDKVYEDFKRAFEKEEAKYYKRQKYFIRPMLLDDEWQIPVIPTDWILKIFAFQGSKEIYIEDLLKEYYQQRKERIDHHLETGELLPWIKLPDFVANKDYEVVFQKGDIIRNPYFDPSLLEEAS